MSATYKPNRSFERQQEAEAMTRQALGLVAKEIAKRAGLAAPHGFMGLRHTYRGGSEGGHAAVFAGPGWHLAEFGTVRTAPKAPLRRTLGALGIKLAEGRG